MYREGPLTRDALSKLIRTKELDVALPRLVAAGRVRMTLKDAEPEYSANEFFVPKGSPVGWEAAVFDHFQALVKTIAQRVSGAAEGREEQIGGSTYSFDVWPGHPHEGEALAQLKEFRQRTSNLRERIRAHNQTHVHPPRFSSVTLYAGQAVIDSGTADDSEPSAAAKPTASQNQQPEENEP